MKTLTIQSKSANPVQLFNFARNEPLLIVTETGEEFILTRADNFDAEVEAIRNSQSFQTFLDERMQVTKKRPLTDLLAEVEIELASIP